MNAYAVACSCRNQRPLGRNDEDFILRVRRHDPEAMRTDAVNMHIYESDLSPDELVCWPYRDDGWVGNR